MTEWVRVATLGGVYQLPRPMTFEEVCARMCELGLRPKDPENLWGAWVPAESADDSDPGEVAGLVRELRGLVTEMKASRSAAVLLSQEEVQERLGCSKSRLYEHFKEGLPYVMVGRKRQVRPADLEAWLETQVIG